LPGHLVATYERALNDSRLLSLRDELALTDAMISELLLQLGDDSRDSKYRRVFRQVGKLIDKRRRLVETEVRHLVLAGEILTAEEALALMQAVVSIVTRYLPDPIDRQALADEIYALMSTGPETPIGARSYG
jgi:translation elongation factor EF-G